jgi:hypothetical protein
MNWADALTTGLAVAGTLGGIWLGHWLGRRSARDERLRDLERLAISDTREWLLDVLDILSAAAARDWWNVWQRGREIGGRRYPTQFPELIADDSLIDELSTTLPEAVEALPRVPRELNARLNGIKYLVNRAMLDQERSLEKTGQARTSSEPQRRRLLEAVERIQRRTHQLNGWQRWRFILQTLLP